MKRSSMKSGITVQPRCRPEGRLFPRRKVASKSHLLNSVGDFDMELSLAIQESLKYAQEKEEQLKRSEPSNVNGPNELDFRCEPNIISNHEVDHKRSSDKAVCSSNSMMASPPSSDWATEEVGRLKDLLLTQAELIQCQQEEINEKNREIQALKSTKDALQCRLERMERRMSILKQKEESQDGNSKILDEGTLRISGPSQSGASSKGKSEKPGSELKSKRKRSSKFSLSHRKRHKHIHVLQPTQHQPPSDNEDESDGGEESSEGTDSEEEERVVNKESENDSDNDNLNADNTGNISEQEEKIIDYPIMQTETLYHLYYPKHVFSCLEVRVSQDKTPQAEVETPTWRLRPLTNMYQLEGTENITDEAYFKRHLKFEMEEKRRKRWDLQRLRELRMFEKFQRQKEDEMRASQDEVDVETFLPSLYDLKHIELTESVPVMAFGQPVPYISPAEFEIPWEITSPGQSSSTSQQRNHSSHSKKH